MPILDHIHNCKLIERKLLSSAIKDLKEGFLEEIHKIDDLSWLIEIAKNSDHETWRIEACKTIFRSGQNMQQESLSEFIKNLDEVLLSHRKIFEVVDAINDISVLENIVAMSDSIVWRIKASESILQIDKSLGQKLLHKEVMTAKIVGLESVDSNIYYAIDKIDDTALLTDIAKNAVNHLYRFVACKKAGHSLGKNCTCRNCGTEGMHQFGESYLGEGGTYADCELCGAVKSKVVKEIGDCPGCDGIGKRKIKRHKYSLFRHQTFCVYCNGSGKLSKYVETIRYANQPTTI